MQVRKPVMVAAVSDLNSQDLNQRITSIAGLIFHDSGRLFQSVSIVRGHSGRNSCFRTEPDKQNEKLHIDFSKEIFIQKQSLETQNDISDMFVAMVLTCLQELYTDLEKLHFKK